MVATEGPAKAMIGSKALAVHVADEVRQALFASAYLVRAEGDAVILIRTAKRAYTTWRASIWRRAFASC